MGSYLSTMASRHDRDPERQSRRRRRTWRILLLLLAIVELAVLVLRGYGPYYPNFSSGTNSGGPVSIATNHSHYRVTESMQLIVTNRLSVPIYTVYFPTFYCSIYLVAQGYSQQEIVGTGCPTTAHACGCGRACDTPARPNEVVEINPDSAYVQVWHPGALGIFAQAGPTYIFFEYSTDWLTIYQLAMVPGVQPTLVPELPNVHGPSIDVATSAALQLEDDGYRPPTPNQCA